MSKPSFRRDRVYLARADIARLEECGCPTCVALRQSIGRDRARRTCLHENALADERVLAHLEQTVGHPVDLGDPARAAETLPSALLPV